LNALFNSTVGSVLGVIITPFWIYYLVLGVNSDNSNKESSYSALHGLKLVAYTVIGPLILGFSLKNLLKKSFNTSYMIKYGYFKVLNLIN
jgi:predicted Na+-dependent transporter